MILSASDIQAKEKTIDGIKIRWGVTWNQDQFDLGEHNITSSHAKINQETSGGFVGSPKFPIAVIFPETLMSSWLFRQAYFDFTDTPQTKDIPPVPDVEMYQLLDLALKSNSDLIYLTQKSYTRHYLKENFLTKYLSSSQISTLPTNWAISNNIKRRAAAFGYMWGFFVPIGEMHRFLKFGIGLGIGILENNININLCDSYTLSIKYKMVDEEKQLADTLEGKCNNSYNLESVSYTDTVLSIGTNITLWERVSKDSIWSIFAMDLATITSLYRDDKLKTVDGKYANFNTTITATDILSYTYRF